MCEISRNNARNSVNITYEVTVPYLLAQYHGKSGGLVCDDVPDDCNNGVDNFRGGPDTEVLNPLLLLLLPYLNRTATATNANFQNH